MATIDPGSCSRQGPRASPPTRVPARDRPRKGDHPRNLSFLLEAPWSAPSPHAPTACAAPPEGPCEVQGSRGRLCTTRRLAGVLSAGVRLNLLNLLNSAIQFRQTTASPLSGHQEDWHSTRTRQETKEQADPAMVMRWPMAHAGLFDGPVLYARLGLRPLPSSHHQHSPSQHTVQLTRWASSIPSLVCSSDPPGQSPGRAWQEGRHLESERRTGMDVRGLALSARRG